MVAEQGNTNGFRICGREAPEHRNKPTRLPLKGVPYKMACVNVELMTYWHRMVRQGGGRWKVQRWKEGRAVLGFDMHPNINSTIL